MIFFTKTSRGLSHRDSGGGFEKASSRPLGRNHQVGIWAMIETFCKTHRRIAFGAWLFFGIFFSLSGVAAEEERNSDSEPPGVSSSMRLDLFRRMAQKAGSAVVNVQSLQKKHFFYGDFHFGMEGTPRFPRLNYFLEQASGSGFFIGENLILTNDHVVEGADKVQIRMADGRITEASLVGKDALMDIALLRIDSPMDHEFLRMGASGEIQVGDWVMAIGSPFGLDQTVTVGVVSAKGRSLGRSPYDDYIQIDAAINPGNSGGPLINTRGEVIGINSSVIKEGQGIGFAIPIDLAMNVVRQLKEKGRVSRGWLGIYFQEVTRDLAESFGMDKPRGALVAKVVPDSPAEKAGLRVGDVIVSYDGKPVDDPGVLPPLVGQTPVGKKVQVEVIRDGEERTFRVTIQELPDADERGGTPHREGGSSFDKRLKLGVGPLDDETRESLGVEDEEGVVVNRIQPGPAFDAGIRKGDVIVMIDGKRVEDVKGFRRIVGELEEGATVPVLVHRSSGPLFLALKVPD